MLRFLFFLCAGIGSLTFASAAEKEPINSYDVQFSDQRSLITQFISLIDQEQKSIELAAYCLRHNGVAKALLAAQKRGVSIDIVVDPFSIRAKSPVKKIGEAKMRLFVWNGAKGKEKKNIMHDTFCIFGGKKVWTGSLDLSSDNRSAKSDTALILEQETLAATFHKEFETLKSKCVSYSEFISQAERL